MFSVRARMRVMSLEVLHGPLCNSSEHVTLLMYTPRIQSSIDHYRRTRNSNIIHV